MLFWEAQQSLAIWEWIARATVMFWWLLIMTKIMGQRQLGRLTTFDYIVAFSIGSTTGGVLNNPENGLVGAIVSVATIALLNILVAQLALKHSKLRRIVQDEPLVIIQNGRIIESIMRKARFNLDDILLELRLKNIPNLHDVEFAILEPNGKLSIIPKSQSRPIKPRDISLETRYEGLPAVLIEDGNIIKDNLDRNNLDISWLKNQLKQQNIESSQEVLAAILDTSGRLYISRKGEKFIH